MAAIVDFLQSCECNKSRAKSLQVHGTSRGSYSMNFEGLKTVLELGEPIFHDGV